MEHTEQESLELLEQSVVVVAQCIEVSEDNISAVVVAVVVVVVDNGSIEAAVDCSK